MGDHAVVQPELQQGRVLALGAGAGQLRLDLDDLGSGQVADDVDVMHRQIDDHADLAHARREGADAGDLDGDDLVVGDGALDRVHGRVEAFDLAHHQDAVVGLGGVYHPLGVGHGGGDRLLDQDVDALFQQGDADFGMESVGRGHDGCVQARVDKGLGGRDRRRLIGGGDPIGDDRIRVEDRGQVELAHLGGDARMVAAHDADAGDAELEDGGGRHQAWPL